MNRTGQRPPDTARAAGGRRPPQRIGRPERDESPVLFGLHAVAAALGNPDREVRRLLCLETARGDLQVCIEDAKTAGVSRPDPSVVPRPQLERLLPAGAVHQGVVLETTPLPPVDLDDMGRAASLRPRSVAIVLDQVTDPHNVGAVLRSAAAFGAVGLVLTRRNAPPLTGTLAKAASGGLEHVPVVRVGNLAKSLEALREWGFGLVGLAEDAADSLPDTALPDRIALVMGAEGSGLRDGTRAVCDTLARLPTEGAIASLNVSNAAAVALYEWFRRG